MAPLPTYVLITPARNEAQFIESTVKSVIAQTVPPVKWVIVSDGSTDGTDEIVSRYLKEYTWIELLRMPERAERHFAGKVFAFDAGYERIKDLGVDVVGNLDADVTFEPDHFEYLLKMAASDPKLGVFGAPFREGTFQYDYRFTNVENVWGGCQLFRRQCFEEIGGYLPLKGGCIDHVAVLSARMHGWKTRTFTERVCLHHRQMGTALHGGLKAKFRMGLKDHTVGNHPLWELFRVFYQMTRRPFVIGGLALGSGYMRAVVERAETPLSPELVNFVRHEQKQRLKRLFGSKSQQAGKEPSATENKMTATPDSRCSCPNGEQSRSTSARL
jgi:biofilm PGA synthesis N-glycosyltransferase PgaC